MTEELKRQQMDSREKLNAIKLLEMISRIKVWTKKKMLPLIDVETNRTQISNTVHILLVFGATSVTLIVVTHVLCLSKY